MQTRREWIEQCRVEQGSGVQDRARQKEIRQDNSRSEQSIEQHMIALSPINRYPMILRKLNHVQLYYSSRMFSSHLNPFLKAVPSSMAQNTLIHSLYNFKWSGFFVFQAANILGLIIGDKMV